MKQVVTRRRACLYDVAEDKIIAILAECYNPNLSDRDILSVVYNPTIMRWVQLPLKEELWIINSNIRVEIINEYTEKESFWKRIKEVRFT